jgi:hypothetical protein
MDSQTAGDDPHGVGMQVLNGGDGDGGELDKTVGHGSPTARGS